MKKIIETYKYNVQNIIKKMTGSYDEDLEQEVYIRTWKSMKLYKEQNRFKSWLNTITYNICKDYLKSSKFKNKCMHTDEEQLDEIGVKDNQEEKIESKETQKRILKEVNRLPKKLKEVVIYHELEDKSYEDIASILNIPIGTVKSRLHNGKELLKIALEDLLT